MLSREELGRLLTIAIEERLKIEGKIELLSNQLRMIDQKEEKKEEKEDIEN